MRRTVTRILDRELVLATATTQGPHGAFTAGACGFTEQDTTVRAESELIERVTLLTEGPRRVVATAAAKDAGGPLREVVESPVPAREWVRAETLYDGRAVWLPADLVLLRWQGSRELIVQQTSVGSAAHPDRSAAIDAGIRECLERYAVRRVWAGTTGLIPLTDQLKSVVPEGLKDALGRQGLTVDAWLVAATLPAAAVLVLVGSSRGRATFGASCAKNVQEGLRHALCEAVSVRAALASSDGLRRNHAMPGEGVNHSLRASSFQDAFVAFLHRLELTDGGSTAQTGDTCALAYLEREPARAPLLVDLGRVDGRQVVKVVVPAPDFFVSRRHRGYVLNPGYLE